MEGWALADTQAVGTAATMECPSPSSISSPFTLSHLSLIVTCPGQRAHAPQTTAAWQHDPQAWDAVTTAFFYPATTASSIIPVVCSLTMFVCFTTCKLKDNEDEEEVRWWPVKIWSCPCQACHGSGGKAMLFLFLLLLNDEGQPHLATGMLHCPLHLPGHDSMSMLMFPSSSSLWSSLRPWCPNPDTNANPTLSKDDANDKKGERGGCSCILIFCCKRLCTVYKHKRLTGLTGLTGLTAWLAQKATTRLDGLRAHCVGVGLCARFYAHFILTMVAATWLWWTQPEHLMMANAGTIMAWVLHPNSAVPVLSKSKV